MRLLRFFKALTHIQQCDVDTAPCIYEALQQMGSWVAQCQPLIWCSWGDYDLKQLKSECARTGAPCPIPSKHFNAKAAYSKCRNAGKLWRHEAIAREGLDWVGTHHRGIDDARNIAQLIPFFNVPKMKEL